MVASRFRRQGEWLEGHLRRYPGDLQAEGDKLTLEYNKASYPITRIRERYVSGERVIEYYLKGEARFERWTRQGELIPPWKFHWHQFRGTIPVYLRRGQLRDLVKRAVDKAGSQTRLAAETKKLGATLHQPNIYRILKGEQKGMTVRRLLPLLAYLNMPYDSIKPLSVPGIKNIKSPIDLDTEHGGRLLGACRGDGSLGRTRGTIRFRYFNTKKELRDSLIESVEKTIGDAHHYTTISRGVPGVGFTSTIVGDVLARGGAPVGRKTIVDAPISPIIRYGKEETIRGYFRRLYSDEGCPSKSCVAYHTRINIHDQLRPEHKEILEKVNWDKQMLPSGAVVKFRRLTEEFKAELPRDLVELIESNPPRAISGEHDLLRSRFDLETKRHACVISETKEGYGVTWRVYTVGGNNLQRFAERIGFDDQEKQKRLENYMRR